MPSKKAVEFQENTIREYVESIVGDDMHAKRVLSLSNAVVGVVHAASLALSSVAKALAMAQGLNPKHALKQLDRFFSNKKFHLDIFFEKWIDFLVKDRNEIIVALDWTEFDKDDQSTLALNLITKHGRATPLVWKTYVKSEMKGRRNFFEDLMLFFLREHIPEACRVTVLADRGFGDTAFFAYIKDQLKFDYIIRFKGKVTMSIGNLSKEAKAWLAPKGNARIFKNVYLTQECCPVPAVVCVHDKGMKEAWFLATSRSMTSSRKIIELYGLRFSIEENFRDVKDIKFGMGLSHISIRKPERRDRILVASAIAVSLLTILGAAGEALGFDRLLKANTVKTRTHSLLTQGAFYFQAMVKYKEEKFSLLTDKFVELMNEHGVFKDMFGWI